MNKVTPALTPEEWLEYAPLDRTLAHHAPALANDNAHGAAALALHGQPYGFTWDDYDELLDNAHEVERDCGPPESLLSERKRQVDALRVPRCSHRRASSAARRSGVDLHPFGGRKSCAPAPHR